MARTKKLNIKASYGGTPYVVNDLGEDKSPRFELYDKDKKVVVSKSNDPYDFDDYVVKKMHWVLGGGTDV